MKRFGLEHILEILQEHRGGMKADELVRKHGISQATFYNWKAKYGSMDLTPARLQLVETENRKLKKQLARATRDNAALKKLLSKNW